MIEIRASEAGDEGGIRAVHVAAFPTPVEAELVEQLERGRDVVLSLVAAEDDRILGHVLISRMTALGDGRFYRAVGLAPVAVLPERQRNGIGSALIREALDRLRAQGEESGAEGQVRHAPGMSQITPGGSDRPDSGPTLVFLVGDPDYYRRFGFETANAAPFASPYAGPYFQAMPLGDAGLPESGRAEYASAFAALE